MYMEGKQPLKYFPSIAMVAGFANQVRWRDMLEALSLEDD